MRRDSQIRMDGEDEDAYEYFTYRPLSRLPTPPPSMNKDACNDQSLTERLEDGELLFPKYRGPAIHLINLIPASSSFATASVPFVQAMLARADLPIETVALAVCILDSLDSKFGRTWRLSCPLNIEDLTAPSVSNSGSKRHSLPSTPIEDHKRHWHIDSVRPEIIILAALVIAAKFTEDPQQPPHFYRVAWGRSTWSNEQLNVTERLIMESLNYRIMPLCDEDYLTDAMVDMQLAGRADQGRPSWNMTREITPPDSVAGSECEFVPGHARSKTTFA